VTKEEIRAEIKEYLRNHLQITVSADCGMYDEKDSVSVKLILEGEVISEDMFLKDYRLSCSWTRHSERRPAHTGCWVWNLYKSMSWSDAWMSSVK